MTELDTWTKQASKTFAATVEQLAATQEQLIKTVRAAQAEAQRNLPSPADLAEQSFDLLSQLIELQKDIVVRALHSASPAEKPRAAQAKA